MIVHHDEPNYARLWTRWVSLTAAAACFIWCGAQWMERRWYQAEAGKTFAEEIRRPAPTQVKRTLPSITAPTAPVAKLEIARLHIFGYVEDGLDSATLGRAIGHSPQSAKLGERGNVVLAAHRDTFFAGLKDVKLGDDVQIGVAVSGHVSAAESRGF